MIADNYLQFRSELETALGDLLKLAHDTRRDATGIDTVQGLLRDVREPLLFVVVGEVKAGKSSLLNALFGQEFARVDVLPATDRIYIFKYGETEKAIEVSPQLVERYQPIEFLRDFNVVDTPGTNTMVAEHQEITEGFIPRADLVLFVFSIVNPWSQSAWDLLNFVGKKWLKNIVFVLQQADLRDAEQVGVILRHLQETALAKLGFAPPIFAVSARKALQAKTSGDAAREQLWNESAFGALEDQINRTVTDSGNRMMKLQSTARTAAVVLDELAGEIRGSYDTIVRDEEQLTRVTTFLATRRDQTLRQVAGFLRGVEQACRECAAAGT
ncbi:MAG: dynamin family protein, partial [Verrucomicrobiota bacterium]|nr:dynamin family protein [Verrucomicrobiota bacterium]